MVDVPGDQLAAVNGCLSSLLATITKSTVLMLSLGPYDPLQTTIAVSLEMAVVISWQLSWVETK